MKIFARTFFLLPAVTFACGSLSAPEDEPAALGTLRGQVTNTAAVATSTGVRAAIVWTYYDPAEPYYFARQAQEATLNPHAGSTSFEIELVEPPPANLLREEYPGLFVATGELVAYEDTNQNGKLDLVEPTAGALVDRLLGVGHGFTVKYIEGQIPAPPIRHPLPATDGSTPPLGYSVYYDNLCDFGRGVDGRCQAQERSWKPIDAPVTLALTDDVARLPANILCRNGATDPATVADPLPVISHPVGELPPELPSDSEPNISCGPGNQRSVGGPLSFDRITCRSPRANLCEHMYTAASCVADRYTIAADAPVPAGWPCFVQ